MSEKARRIDLTYTEVQVPLLQRTMEYDHAPVLALLLLGTAPIPDRDVAAVRELAVRHPIPPTPRHTAS